MTRRAWLSVVSIACDLAALLVGIEGGWPWGIAGGFGWIAAAGLAISLREAR